MKCAFITGITGQDGSYLAELLLEKGYLVHGLVRHSSSQNFSRIVHLIEDQTLSGRLCLHEGDLIDCSNLRRLLKVIQPDEIYNLAAMSHVGTSFEIPIFTAEVDAVGVISLLEVVRDVCPQTRFYQASTSELYGKVQEIPQTEKTPFYPRSPYGVAKLCGYWAVISYREAYGLYACNGILFNHESPRRGENFVSRKITLAVARISLGIQEKVILGHLSSKRDWGFAKDFVEGMWLMLQQAEAEDFVLATGQTTEVRHFVELAFREVGISIIWKGTSVEERGINAQTGKTVVEVSPEFFRPAEVDLLIGNPQKAKEKLGWQPRTNLTALVKLMVESDLVAVARRVYH